MLMDERTKKLLDFERVLAELHPITPFGIKCKNSSRFYSSHKKQQLEEELLRVEQIKGLIELQATTFMELKAILRQVKDIRRSVERCIMGGVLSTVELFELKNLGELIGQLSKAQSRLQWKLPTKYRLEELLWLEQLLDPDKTGLKTFYLYDSYSEELTRIRSSKQRLEHELDRHKRQWVKSIEQELGVTFRVTCELSVSKSSTELIQKLKSHPMLQLTNETYASTCFRIKPDEEMHKIGAELELLKTEEAAEEASILERLSRSIAAHGEELLKSMDAIGEFDLLMAKGYLAIGQRAVRPMLTDKGLMQISDGRNPVVEAELKKRGKVYKTISVCLDKAVTLITGANMGGKTVSLKMMGLLAAMAHFGLLVPAHYMELQLYDFIFLSAGDEQSIDLGLSTFGAEMLGIRDMLSRTDERGLVLVDELARGTNPHEGYAISFSIIDYLLHKPCTAVITTHFDGLVRHETKHLQVNGLRNLSEELISTPELISEHMDYTLIEADQSSDVPKDAIRISKLMGIPKEIIDKAEEIMKNS